MYLCFLLLLLIVGGEAVDITTCTALDQPGTYDIINDISGSDMCIIIHSSNVEINGNGFAVSGNIKAIDISGPYSDIYIHDLAINNSAYAINAQQVTRLLVSNVHVYHMQSAYVTGAPGLFYFKQCVNLEVRNCLFTDITYLYSLMAVDTNTGYAKIHDNVVQGVRILYHTQLFLAKNVQDVLFENNDVSGITYECPSFMQVTAYQCVFCGFQSPGTVRNNTITNLEYHGMNMCYEWFAPIAFSGLSSFPQYVTVKNNHVSAMNIDGSANIRLIQTDFIQGQISIVGNVFTNLRWDQQTGIITPWGCSHYLAFITIANNSITDTTSVSSVGSSNLECKVSLIYNNTVTAPTIFGGSSYMHCPSVVTNAANWSRLCYPPEAVPCCHNCAVDGFCNTNYTSDSYNLGTCSAPDAVCESSSNVVSVYVEEVTPNPASAGSNVFLKGPGLDFWSSNIKAFIGTTPVSLTWTNNEGYYMNSNGDEGAVDVTVSLDGVYSPSQTPYRVYFIESTPNLNLYTSHTNMYIYWYPYTGTLPVIGYNVTFRSWFGNEEDARVETRLVTETSVEWPYALVERENYGATMRPVFDFGPGFEISFCCDTFYPSGPTNIAEGSPADDSFSKLLYNEANNKFFVVGTTTGSIDGTTVNDGTIDVFLATLDASGAVNILKQGRTSGDDPVIDAVLGSDGNVYVLAGNASRSYLITLSSTTFEYSPLFDDFTGTYAASAIIEANDGRLWVVGSTDGHFNDGNLDTTKSAFVAIFSKQPSVQYAESRTWRLNDEEIVNDATFNKETGVLYIVGTTASNGDQAGFISQFNTQIVLADPVSVVYHYTFNDPHSTFTPNLIAFSETRNLLAITAGDIALYVPVSAATGFIDAYRGCQLSPQVFRSYELSSFWPAKCRDTCASEYKFAYMNSTHCLCSNEDASTLNSHPTACNAYCTGSNTDRCGGELNSENYFSVYKSKASENGKYVYMPIGNFIYSEITSIYFVPSSAHHLMIMGYNYYAKITDDLDTSMTPSTFFGGTTINGAAVFPDSLLTVMIGSVSNISDYPDIHVDGFSDAYASLIYPRDSYQSSDILFEYENFTALTLTWGRPTEIPDSLAVNYKLHMVNRQNTSDTVIYDGPGTQFVFTDASGFGQYYYLVSTFGDQKLTLTPYRYAARIVQLEVEFTMVDYSPIVHHDETTGEFLTWFAEDDGADGRTTIVRVNPVTGSITPVLQSGNRYSAVDFLVLPNDVFVGIFAPDALSSPIALSENNLFWMDSDLTQKTVLAGSVGSGDWLYLTGHFQHNVSTYYPFVNIYTSDAVFNRSITFEDVEVNLNYLSFVGVQAHSSKPLVYVFCYRAEGRPVIVELNVEDLSYTLFDIPDLMFQGFSYYSWPTAMVLSSRTDELFVTSQLQGGQTSGIAVITFDMVSKSFKASDFAPSSSNVDIRCALSDTYGQGIWRADKYFQEGPDRMGINLLYSDRVGKERAVAQLDLAALPRSSYDLGIKSIAYGNLNVAVGGQFTGVHLGFSRQKRINGYYMLFVDEIASPTTFFFEDTKTTNVTMKWAAPQGISADFADTVFYSVQMGDWQGHWTEVCNTTSSSCEVSSMLPLRTYHFSLTAYYGDYPQQALSYNSTKVCSLSDGTEYFEGLPTTFSNSWSTYFSGGNLYLYGEYFSRRRDSLYDLKQLHKFDPVYATLVHSWNITSNWTIYELADFAVDDTSIFYSVSNLNYNQVLVCREYLVQVSGPLELLNCKNITHRYASEFVGLRVIPLANEILLIGTVFGNITGQQALGNKDLYVGFMDGAGDITYIQFGTPDDDYFVSAAYNHENQVVYIFSNPTKIFVLDITSRTIVQTFIWNNDEECYYSEIALSQAGDSITIVGSHENEDTAFTCITKLEVDADGFVVDNSNTSLRIGGFAVYKAPVAIPNSDKVLFGGYVERPIEGYNMAGPRDMFFGFNYDPVLVIQDGKPHMGAQFVGAHVDPTSGDMIVVQLFYIGYDYTPRIRIERHVEPRNAPSLNWVSPFSMKLKWPAIDNYYFAIQMAEGSSPYQTIATSGTEILLTTADGIYPNTSYKFQTVLYSSIFGAVTSLQAQSYSTYPIPTLSLGVITTISVQVQWDNVHFPWANYYLMYQSYPGGPFTQVSELTALSGSFNVTNLFPETSYAFRVDMTDRESNSYNTNTISTTTTSPPEIHPDPPTLYVRSHHFIALNWTREFDAVYTLQLSNGAGEYFTVYNYSYPQYRVGGLMPNTLYQFRFKVMPYAYNGYYYYSTVVGFYTQALPTLSITEVAATSVNVSWQNIVDAERITYTLQYDSEGFYQDVGIFNSDSGSQLVGSLTPQVSYTFRIKIQDSINSTYTYYSSVYAVTTLAEPTTTTATTTTTTASSTAAQSSSASGPVSTSGTTTSSSGATSAAASTSGSTSGVPTIKQLVLQIIAKLRGDLSKFDLDKFIYDLQHNLTTPAQITAYIVTDKARAVSDFSVVANATFNQTSTALDSDALTRQLIGAANSSASSQNATVLGINSTVIIAPPSSTSTSTLASSTTASIGDEVTKGGSDHKGRNIGLGVGLGIGLPLLIVAGVLVFYFRKRKQENMGVRMHSLNSYNN